MKFYARTFSCRKLFDRLDDSRRWVEAWIMNNCVPTISIFCPHYEYICLMSLFILIELPHLFLKMIAHPAKYLHLSHFYIEISYHKGVDIIFKLSLLTFTTHIRFIFRTDYLSRYLYPVKDSEHCFSWWGVPNKGWYQSVLWYDDWWWGMDPTASFEGRYLGQRQDYGNQHRLAERLNRTVLNNQHGWQVEKHGRWRIVSGTV